MYVYKHLLQTRSAFANTYDAAESAFVRSKLSQVFALALLGIRTSLPTRGGNNFSSLQHFFVDRTITLEHTFRLFSLKAFPKRCSLLFALHSKRARHSHHYLGYDRDPSGSCAGWSKSAYVFPKVFRFSTKLTPIRNASPTRRKTSELRKSKKMLSKQS
jgi:hypothetical protein